MTYDDAVTALYQASVESFVSERKRLAGELKAGGDKTGSAKLAKLGRPTLSAWAANQLWWHARDAFEALFETAERIRSGELAAQAPHRDALANLRGRAARILTDAGHNANEATLRRVTTTLSALAAAGGFSPDPAGALAEDREPLGFDVALSLAHVPVRPATPAAKAKPAPEPEPPEHEVEEQDEEEEAARRDAAQRELDDDKARDNDAENENEATEARPKRAYDITKHRASNEQTSEAKHDEQREREAASAAKRAAEAEKRRDHEAAEKKRADEKDARAKAAAERSKLIANLATAQSELARRKRVVGTLSEQLEIAEQQVAEAEDIIAKLQAKLEEHA
ncbi:MAG TPA: hypothetical protein VGO00_02725 [Kofleriaceae bacterium]|jgi:hypothetical protein|nr:hypothetical protein [Kofleriaceae bacterium]